jgi:hypothetical protein
VPFARVQDQPSHLTLALALTLTLPLNLTLTPTLTQTLTRTLPLPPTLPKVEDVLIGPVSEVFRRNGIAAQSSDGASCFSNLNSFSNLSPSPNPSALALARALSLTLASTLSLTRRQLLLSRAH